MEMEWARFPDDILWRRTKLGLSMELADRDALAAFMMDEAARAVAQAGEVRSGYPQYCGRLPSAG
jgi:glycerol-3-phosphate dehydrogenase